MSGAYHRLSPGGAGYTCEVVPAPSPPNGVLPNVITMNDHLSPDVRDPRRRGRRLVVVAVLGGLGLLGGLVSPDGAFATHTGPPASGSSSR